MNRITEWHKGGHTVPGVSISGKDVILTTELPSKGEKYLLLYDPVTGEQLQEIPLSEYRSDGTLASIFLKDAAKSELAYLFRTEDGTKIDPCAIRIRNGFGFFNAGIGKYAAKEASDFSVESIRLYKLHVRGFTMKSNLKPELRGTYEGLRKKLNYIRELGFNAVELMPTYEFDETLTDGNGQSIDDRKNYWGYAEQNYYFAPKERYASGSNINTEMHALIRDMHRKDLLAIMEIYVPVKLSTYMLTEILHFWRRIYHVDGFHLVGQRVRASLFAEDPALRTTLLIFNYLDEDDLIHDPLSKKHVLLASDSFEECGRRFLKGDENQSAYFASAVLKNSTLWTPVNFMASTDGFTLRDAVTYSQKHNEENGEGNRDGRENNLSWNCGEEGQTKKKAITELRKRQIKNALAYVLLSQGVPMLNAGDERENTQGGNNNAYCQDNETGWVDWNRTAFSVRLTEYVRKLIAFRESHPILHSPERLRESDYRALGYPEVSLHGENAWVYDFDREERSIGMMLSGQYASLMDDGNAEDIYLAFNGDWRTFSFALPRPAEGREWCLIMNTAAPEGEEFPAEPAALSDQKSYEGAPRSVAVLVSRQAAAPVQPDKKAVRGKGKAKA